MPSRNRRSARYKTRKSKHGGDKTLVCGKSKKLFCDSESDIKPVLLQLHRSLSKEQFRDSLLSLPLLHLRAILGMKEGTLEPHSVTHSLLSVFIRYMPRPSDTTPLSSTYALQLEEICARSGGDGKMFVYYTDDSSAISDADCYEVLCRYLHVVDEKLVDKATLTSLLSFLKNLSSTLITSPLLEDGYTESSLLSAKQSIDVQINQPVNAAFRSLDFVSAIDKAYAEHDRKRGNSRSLALLSSRLLAISQDLTVHIIVLDSLLQRLSPLCANKTAVIQSLNNPAIKCPIRPAEGSPAVCFIYLLTRAAGKLQLLRVLLISGTDKVLYACPFSPVYSDRESVLITNASLFNDKIKERLLSTTTSSQKPDRLFELPYELQNKPINCDFYSKLPYFEFWSDFAKTVSNFLSSTTTSSFIRSREDVFDYVEGYFNFTFLMSLCHNVKNYALNARKYSFSQTIETTTSLLVDCDCVQQDDNVLKTARAKFDNIVFNNSRREFNDSPSVSGLNNLPYGAIYIPAPSKEDVKSRKDVEPVLRSLKFDKFKKFYDLFATSVTAIARRVEPLKLTSASDPLMEVVQKIIVQTNNLKEVDDGLESQTEVVKKLREALKVGATTPYSSGYSSSAWVPSSAIKTLPKQLDLNSLSADDKFKAIMAWR